MSVEDLQIIAQDGRGLSAADRVAIASAAAQLEAMSSELIRMHYELVEARQQNSAQAERIRELTTPRPTVYGQFLLVTLRAAHVPSWMKFDWCK